MALLSAIGRALRPRQPMLLGEVTSPRRVSIEADVVRDTPIITSPFSGEACAYFHAEVGEERPVVDLSGKNEVARFFRKLAEHRSDQDLVVVTDDRRRIVLPTRYFLVVARTLSDESTPLGIVPGEVASAVAAERLRGVLAYREILLRAADRVRFSGVVEAVRTDEQVDYRRAPRVSYRMRPEREPIIVEAVT
jgi:hypothetical protein